MNHITEQMKRNAEKFDKNMPERGWMPEQITHEEQGDIKLFGYKYFSSGQIHEVTDWGHLKRFLASAQVALLQAVREEVGLPQEITNYIKGDVFLHGQIFGSNEMKNYITQILDEAITKARKNI